MRRECCRQAQSEQDNAHRVDSGAMTREGRRRNLNLRLRAERGVLHARRGNKRKLLVPVPSCTGYRVLSVLKHAKTLRVFCRKLKGRDELLALLACSAA